MSKKFKEFIEAYESFRGSKKAAESINSSDASERDAARMYALDAAAKNIPGFEAIASNPIAAAEVLGSDASVDKLLSHAGLHFASLSEQRFTLDRKDIIANVPEKGLAAIVLSRIPSLKTKGDKVSEAHAAYQELMSILPEREEQINHKELLEVLAPQIDKKIKAKISADKYLGKVKGLADVTVATARFILAKSPTSCLNGTIGLINEYKKEFESYLSKESDRAKYARGILTKMKDVPIAMAAVYEATQVANNAKKKK